MSSSDKRDTRRTISIALCAVAASVAWFAYVVGLSEGCGSWFKVLGIMVWGLLRSALIFLVIYPLACFWLVPSDEVGR